MNAQALAIREIETDRVTRDVERWLSRDTSVNLAPDMYIGDLDDHRWVYGHSSLAYYVKRDEQATSTIVKKELDAEADNMFDLGVGGKQAVRDGALVFAKKIGAKNYYGLDLATTLADGAAEEAESEGLNATAVVCDIFERLPIRRQSTFVNLVGLTLGNIETYDDPQDVQDRLKEIFTHYAHAVTSSSPQIQALAKTKLSHLLISYDANRNVEEVRDCYFNPEMGSLVRSCVDKAIDTSGFDYDVVLRETPEILFVSTGLRAKHDQIIHFNGKDFAIEKDQFLPVLNSSRFSTAFMTEAAVQAGWRPKNIWSATGRVQYQHFTIG